MVLSNIDNVRMKTSDRSMHQREEWEDANGTITEIRLQFSPVLTSPVPRVWKDGVLLTAGTQYVIDYSSGIVTLAVAPLTDSLVLIDYYSVVFSDDEVNEFLSEASDNTTLAAANMLLAWAADAARIAKKESLSGGGGIGSVSVTTDMRARELRETAKAYFLQYEKVAGSGVAVEMLTEIAWTDHMADRMEINRVLENV